MLELVLVEVNILTCKSRLELVSVGKNRGQKRVDPQRNNFHYFAFSFRRQQLPPAPFPHSPQAVNGTIYIYFPKASESPLVI